MDWRTQQKLQEREARKHMQAEKTESVMEQAFRQAQDKEHNKAPEVAVPTNDLTPDEVIDLYLADENQVKEFFNDIDLSTVSFISKAITEVLEKRTVLEQQREERKRIIHAKMSSLHLELWDMADEDFDLYSQICEDDGLTPWTEDQLIEAMDEVQEEPPAPTPVQVKVQNEPKHVNLISPDDLPEGVKMKPDGTIDRRSLRYRDDRDEILIANGEPPFGTKPETPPTPSDAQLSNASKARVAMFEKYKYKWTLFGKEYMWTGGARRPLSLKCWLGLGNKIADALIPEDERPKAPRLTKYQRKQLMSIPEGYEQETKQLLARFSEMSLQED